jgi:hypothetical protein
MTRSSFSLKSEIVIPNKKAGYLRKTPSFFFKNSPDTYVTALALSNSKHLGATYRANALCRRFLVLHGYRPGILHLPFGTAFDTIGLHNTPSFLIGKDKPFLHEMSIV